MAVIIENALAFLITIAAKELAESGKEKLALWSAELVEKIEGKFDGCEKGAACDSDYVRVPSEPEEPVPVTFQNIT